MKNKIILSFSGGKDSVLALYRLMQSDEYDVVGLLVTVDSDSKVLMHGFARKVVVKQAESLSIPLFLWILKFATDSPHRKAS